MNRNSGELIRGLTLTDTAALVVGSVIGTGVFLKAAVMAQAAGTPMLVLAAWVAAGLLSLAGALTYAELGAMLPQAGGEYVYLRKAYGDLPAFLFGWMRVVVGATGIAAVLGVGFATFLAAVVPLETVWARRDFTLFGQAIHWQFGLRQVVAVAAILFFSGLNCLSVAFGGRVQSFLTALKLGSIALLVGGILLFSGSADWSHLATPAESPAWTGWAAFGVAMLGALWAYEGWNGMQMVAGEVQDPGRNLPRALVGGMVVVTLVYCIANLSYFYALPFGEVLSANSTAHPEALPVATRAAQTVFGELGGKLVTIMFILSALGALNGIVLVGARVPYAMARSGLFFRRAGVLNGRTLVPVWAILMQAAWACVLAVSGTFDQLTDYVVFASWCFYALVTSSVFVLRRKMPDAARPYRTLGYPVVPAVFVLVALWLVYNTLVNRPVESVIGLMLIALGLPVYGWFRRAQRLESEASS